MEIHNTLKQFLNRVIHKAKNVKTEEPLESDEAEIVELSDMPQLESDEDEIVNLSDMLLLERVK